MTAILGISAFYHDSAAALVRDGEVVAAAHPHSVPDFRPADSPVQHGPGALYLHAVVIHWAMNYRVRNL